MVKFILSVLIILSINNASALGLDSDSGIKYKSYQDITNQLIELNKNHPLTTKLINLGVTKNNTKQFALIYSKQFPAKKIVMMTGATHGNEYLNIVDRLTTKLIADKNQKTEDYLNQGGAFLFIPIVNPDGFSARRRTGSRRSDLNRDFPNKDINLEGLKNEETQNIVSFISNYVRVNQTQLKVVIDYHCCNGSLLYPWSYTKTRIPSQDLVAHQEIAKLMLQYLPGYTHGITGEVLGYYPKGTSKDFWYQEFNALAFTFEGRRANEYKNLNGHYLWWSDIVQKL